MRLKGMLDGEDGEREGLIRQEDREGGNQQKNTIKYIKEGISSINSTQNKLGKNNKKSKKSKSKRDSNRNNFENEESNIGIELVSNNEKGPGEIKSEWEFRDDDGGLFESERRHKKGGLLSGKAKKLFKGRCLYSNKHKNPLITTHDDDDDDAHTNDGDDTHTNDDDDSDVDCYHKNRSNKKKKKKKKKKVKLSFDDDDDVNEEMSGELKCKKKKSPKRIAKKVGSKTWKGVKVAWKFLCTGLRSLSVPLGSWDVSVGVMGVVRDWSNEVQRRQELLAGKIDVV